MNLQHGQIIDGRTIGSVFLTCCTLLFLIACSSTKPETILRNEGISYEPGFPHISMSSDGYYNQQNRRIITVTTDIVPSSLITFQDDSLSEGETSVGFDIFYEIHDRNENSESINVSESHTFSYDSQAEAQQAENIILTQEFEVLSAGTYEVMVIVRDKKSTKEWRSGDTVIIPDLTSNDFGISSVRFTALDSSDAERNYVAITTYDVTKDFDELLFQSQVTNTSSGDSLRVDAKVIKFRSDNAPAERMSAPEYTLSTLQRNGIDYSDKEIIYSQSRYLKPGDKVFTYEVGLPTPPVGNYRYEITVWNVATGERLSRAFDFGVKREGFPLVKTTRDLAETLYYLMDRREYERLLKISDTDSLKKAVDDFWLQHLENANKARSAIDLYYRRVEEANKYYSSYKEGWKTDLGMIYILFGPPRYSYDTFDYIHWSYSVDRYSSRYNYYFRKERRRSNVFPFNLYLLDRSDAQLRENEYIILNRWLSGNIIN